MIGTEKQIAWGEKIKVKLIKEVDEKLNYITGLLERKGISEENAPDKIKNNLKVYRAIKEKIETEEKAEWFINHQELTFLVIDYEEKLGIK